MRFLSNVVASALGALVALGVLGMLSFLIILALAASTDSEPSVPGDAVLEVRLDGPVPENDSDDPLAELLDGGNGARYDLRAFRKGLRMAAADERIRAVVLQAEGADAGWAQLQEMRTALETYKESGKPLYATTGETGMAESDYLLASAADSVFASPEALFEFNGFALQSQFFSGTLDKLGVEATAVRAGEFKSAVEQFTRSSYSAQNERQLTEIVETINDEYKRAVSQSRGLPVDSLETIADSGAVFSAEDALSAGLVDDLVYENEMDTLLTRRLGYDDVDDDHRISLNTYAGTSSSAAGLDSGGGGDGGEIAVVYGAGRIVSEEPDGLGGGSNVLAPAPFREAMQEAREDDDTRAVVVRVNSPGGQVAPSEAMRHEVKLTAQDMPVLVSMSNLAASGGYWLSAPADTIVADPLTLTGSIGVFSLLFNTQELFNRELGITFDKVTTGPYADFSTVAPEPISPQRRRRLQRYVSDTYDDFLKHVAEGRGMTVAEVDSIGQGRVWTGRAAEEQGLVDALGGLDTTVTMAAEQAGLAPGSYDVEALPKPKSFFERYMESLSERASALWRGWRLSEAEGTLLRNARKLRRLRQRHAEPLALWPVRPRIE
ncbi:MAG: signal peptide peptidase SppA [Bacteroidetes bacterium QS_8_68_15]|nr:MAG: signal peptide peptidase SppA [Bacteroidetes bacterium QS_8_68_15]